MEHPEQTFGMTQGGARAMVEGLGGLSECRNLAGQSARSILAMGGNLLDHEFREGELGFAFQIWARHDDRVAFMAGMRAALRCLVDTREPWSVAAPGVQTRVRIHVTPALDPPRHRASPLILDLLALGIDVHRLAGELRAAASGEASRSVSATVDALLKSRPGGVSVPQHLGDLLGRLGVLDGDAAAPASGQIRVTALG